MNTDQLYKVLKERCRKTFLGVYAIDQLPRTLPTKRPLLLVCNTDPIQKPGQHWIAIYIGPNSYGEYFDSLGLTVPSTFKKFLDRYCSRWITVDRQLQSVISSFCGHYCVYYCYWREKGRDLNKIVNSFTNDTGLNDFIAHKFSCGLVKIEIKN